MSHVNGLSPQLPLRQSVCNYMKLAQLSDNTQVSYL